MNPDQQSSQFPPLQLESYDRKIGGVIGTFGSGLGIRVYYLQASLPPSYLNSIKLVQEIPGSDRWPVRDLFQREVDTERVEHGILPWLQDSNKVKFFNPLTLTLIPIDARTHTIIREIPKLAETKETLADGRYWRSLEWKGFYRFKYLASETRSHNEFAVLEWNAERVHVVAIDGQHRLSALKQYLRDREGPAHDEFLDWQVPVVITGLDCTDGRRTNHSVSLLDVVRNMFVTINTQARTPSRSRQILLNDESVIHVCTQEILEYSHQNDAIEGNATHDKSRLPLLFWDWRGESQEGSEVRSPAAVKPITELADWLAAYVIGEDFSEYQQEVFGVTEDDVLFKAFEKQALTADSTRNIRDRFTARLLPSVVYLLENFGPYSAYNTAFRQAEMSWQEKGASYRHALSRLRFGSHAGSEDQARQIGEAYSEIVDDICDIKKRTIPGLLGLDIGFRGVMWAFGELKAFYNEWEGGRADDEWLPYSRWFTEHLNQATADEWFGRRGNQHRLYVTRDLTDGIINHRITDAQKALGPFVLLLVCAYALRKEKIVDEDRWNEIWETYADNVLFGTIRNGYLRQLCADLRSSHPDLSAKTIRERAAPGANRSAHQQLKKLRNELD